MLKFGFYDSDLNGDRTYNADDMSRIFDGIILDGVYQYCDDHMEITPENDENGFGVNIAAGRAWFNRTWTYVDSPLFLRVNRNNSGDDIRYDFVALVIDKRDSARQNFFVICEGSPNYSGPVVEGQVFVHYFAKIKITRGAMVLHQSDITPYEGVAEFEYEGDTYPGAPWVTGPLDTISIDDLIVGWTNDMHNAINAAIDDYFDGLTVATKPADLGQGYGVCTTAAATAAKKVSITDFKLTNGGIVAIKFNYGFPAGGTLNINSTGAKPIYHGSLPVANDVIQNGNIVTLVYDAGSGVYRVLAIDTGIGDNGNVENVLYFPIRNQGGQLMTDLTSTIVYNDVVRDEKNILYCLVDATNRVTPYAVASLSKKPVDTTEAVFTAIDAINGALSVYTLNASGVVTREAKEIGSYSKPNTGIPDTDLASDVRSKLTNAGMGQGYGVCTTVSGIYYKTVSLEGYELEVGGIVAVWFAYDIWGILSHDITLNINNKGDKPIYYQGSPITSGLVHANDIVTMIYDGNYYHVISINQFSKFEVDFSISGSIASCDKAYSDILDAEAADNIIIPRYNGLQGIYIGGDNGTKVQFMFFDNRVAGSNPVNYIFTIDNYNNITFVARTMSFDPAVVTVSGDTPTIASAQDNIVYDLTGTGITSVTITAREAGAAFSVLFNTPAGLTAPTFFYPTSNMYMPDDFALDVYRHYEINVDSRGFATVNSWSLD